ncbi:MAG: hypothetical protein ACK4PR_09255, partial [Gammaproteobacteria bacterium]
TDGVTDGAGVKRTSSIEWSYPFFFKKEQSPNTIPASKHPSPTSPKHTFATTVEPKSSATRQSRKLANSGSSIPTTSHGRLKRKLTSGAGMSINDFRDGQHSWTNENVSPGKMEKKDIKQRSWTLNDEKKKSENKPSSNDDAASLTTRSNTCG